MKAGTAARGRLRSWRSAPPRLVDECCRAEHPQALTQAYAGWAARCRRCAPTATEFRQRAATERRAAMTALTAPLRDATAGLDPLTKLDLALGFWLALADEGKRRIA